VRLEGADLLIGSPKYLFAFRFWDLKDFATRVNRGNEMRGMQSGRLKPVEPLVQLHDALAERYEIFRVYLDNVGFAEFARYLKLIVIHPNKSRN
jgi:hypothetical protein